MTEQEATAKTPIKRQGAYVVVQKGVIFASKREAEKWLSENKLDDGASIYKGREVTTRTVESVKLG